jgi:hypothetical protein
MKSIKAKTLNGRPTSVAELSVAKLSAENVSSSESKPEDKGEGSKPKGLLSRLVNISNKVNLVLAGMYTGVTCYGVPREEHRYGEQGADAPTAKKPRT